MSGANIANVVFDMEESGEIDHEKCFVPKVESDQDWKKKNADSMPESKYWYYNCNTSWYRELSIKSQVYGMVLKL